jgi:DNA repair exonuclease SbcCD ATPase subunit
MNTRDNYKFLLKKANQFFGMKEALKKEVEDIVIKINNLQKSLEILSKVKSLFEFFIKSVEKESKTYIEPIVTEALHFVFNQDLYFHIMFVDRRNQIEVDFIVLPNKETEDLYQSYIENLEEYAEDLEKLRSSYNDIPFLYGGAVTEVLGIILRFLFAELLNIKGPIFLDEPTSAVHEDYAGRVGQFIKSLSEKFNRQVVYVTHSHALVSTSHKVYEVEKDKDISHVKEI